MKVIKLHDPDLIVREKFFKQFQFPGDGRCPLPDPTPVFRSNDYFSVYKMHPLICQLVIPSTSLRMPEIGGRSVNYGIKRLNLFVSQI